MGQYQSVRHAHQLPSQGDGLGLIGASASFDPHANDDRPIPIGDYPSERNSNPSQGLFRPLPNLKPLKINPPETEQNHETHPLPVLQKTVHPRARPAPVLLDHLLAALKGRGSAATPETG